jgi:hypothetical protein
MLQELQLEPLAMAVKYLQGREAPMDRTEQAGDSERCAPEG